MGAYNFADNYKAAGLAPSPEIVRSRQEPFEKLRKELNTERAIDLTRLYFGIATSEPPEWFRGAFSGADPSFTLIDNAREAAVLASCLLAAGLEDKVVAAGLAPLTAAAAGHRTPLVRPELLVYARDELRKFAVRMRRRPVAASNEITAPQKGKSHESAEGVAAGGDWVKVGAALKLVSDESLAATRKLGVQVTSVVSSLSQQIAGLEEEVSMLWWYIGGWSRVLDRPLVELEPALAAAMAGMDLGTLTLAAPGPVAAPALLARLVTAGRPTPLARVSIGEAVDAFPTNLSRNLELQVGLERVPDLCPILTGFRKAAEIGDTPAWHLPFQRVAHLDVSTAFHPAEFALQAYRETLLVSLLDS